MSSKIKLMKWLRSIEEIKKQLHEQMEFNKKLVERMDRKHESYT